MVPVVKMINLLNKNALAQLELPRVRTTGRSLHMKKCTKCKQNKSSDQFYEDKSSKNGLRSNCKLCSNNSSIAWYKANIEIEQSKKKSWRQRNPVKVMQQNRRDNLKKNYGVSVKDWDILFEKQNGLCAICSQSETVLLNGKLKRLAIDHCHLTKKVRGLLCAKCNKGLGLFKDKPELLNQAAKYLELHS